MSASAERRSHFGVKVDIEVVKGSDWIHTFGTSAANVGEFTQSAEPLHSDARVVYIGFGYQGIANRHVMS